MRHSVFAASLGGVLLAATAGTAMADEGVIKASCVEGGRVVYREDLPAKTSADRRLQIAAKYRQALCVFARTEPAAAMPDVVDPVLAGTLGGGNGDLASALSYLGTGKTEVGTPYGGAFDKGMQEFMKAENVFSSPENTVNLTIGVYAGSDTETVVGHWGYIKENTTYLARMTPSIETVGDVTVLSVENVSDGYASRVCEEAEKVASGCIAVY
jgi:hypothetical protein|nr:hypothetical protein [Neorhizobium tomejilense]